jgi:hypothetical protein
LIVRAADDLCLDEIKTDLETVSLTFGRKADDTEDELETTDAALAAT